MSAIYHYEPLSELLLLNVHTDKLYFIYTQFKKHFSPYRYAYALETKITKKYLYSRISMY